MKPFEAKLSIYNDRINYHLPLAAKALGPLQVLEFDSKAKRLVIEPGGDPRKTGRLINGMRRYQYTCDNDPKFWGTFKMKGWPDKGRIILELDEFKTPEEVFG
jgi:hypothetical protein